MIFKHGVPNNSSQQIIEVHKWSMSADYSSAHNLFKSANYSHKQLNLPQIDYLIDSRLVKILDIRTSLISSNFVNYQ